MKKFLISIDTEGDDLWSWKLGDKITTENAKYLPRFQEMCDRFGFKPTYLTNYEMAMDSNFVNMAKEKLEQGKCEVGMHLHAWNTPPEYNLSIRTDIEPAAPYLIEYPKDVMEEKIRYMTELLEKQFGERPITHRAGRWAMNEDYFELLSKYGYIADCSVTPGISWEKAVGQSPDSNGSNYESAPLYPYLEKSSKILELPMTIRENYRIKKNPHEGIRKVIRNYYQAMIGQGKIWLRPNGRNLEDMLYLVDCIDRNPKDDYLMFMLHSSEFMPGGCQRFDTKEKIESLYKDLEILFSKIAEKYEGMTIGEYALEKLR